jgi:hypothetical protein
MASARIFTAQCHAPPKLCVWQEFCYGIIPNPCITILFFRSLFSAGPEFSLINRDSPKLVSGWHNCRIFYRFTCKIPSLNIRWTVQTVRYMCVLNWGQRSELLCGYFATKSKALELRWSVRSSEWVTFMWLSTSATAIFPGCANAASNCIASRSSRDLKAVNSIFF